MARPQLEITVYFIREGEKIIAYAPSLQLTSSGRNQQEARRAFERALDIFVDSLEEMGTLEKALKDLGWRRVQTPMQPWKAPAGRVPTHLLARREMRVPLPA